LPAEIIEAIIDSAWHMPLSSDERITLMRSSLLVSSTWADIFDLVSSRDVYILSAVFCDHFIQRLCSQPPAVSPSIQSRSANQACQSITIQIANADIHFDRNARMRLPMGGVLDHLLENLDVWSLAPNLRRLSIEYVDAGFEDIFRRTGPAALPTQITHLDLRYSFSRATPTWLVEALRKKQERQRHIGWIAPSITRLSIVGAGENTIRDMLLACPNVK
ncbi:hypothetical protein B0H13DRAFT_1460664, partial [Mycena leptocephala]